MEITYTSGEKDIICSDETWKFSFDGPIRVADLFLGETFDARMQEGNPSLKTYDEMNWEPVIAKAAPDDTIEAQAYPPVRIFEELPAKKVWTAPNGDTLVDFGQNLAGMLRVNINGTKDEVITFEHGETLNKDGNYFYVFEGTNKEQKDTYICNGEEEIFQPKFTYHGFRYVRVKGGSDWSKEQLTALAISTENPVTGTFSCSDGQLNQLQHNIYWSQRSNNIGIPMDCPTREKAGWTGDVVVYGATTIWENWDAIRDDGQMNECSFNHYAFGCVGDFLYRRVLGIQNAGVGYDKILLAPGYECPLSKVEGTYESIHGEIQLCWKRMAKGLR